MAVDMRARYFGEFDEGAMPSFGVLPQAAPQPSAFEVMPMSGARPYDPTSYLVNAYGLGSYYVPGNKPPRSTDYGGLLPTSNTGVGVADTVADPVNLARNIANAPTAAPIMDTPRQAAVMPMTTEAVAPMSYEALADRRIAANTRPQGSFLAAPMDNLGVGTGYDIAGQGSNLFEYQGGPVRVTDRKGNVLFSGEGPEGAVAAARFAQNLSDTKGKNASWDIQQGERTINPDGSVGPTRWVSGPSDAKEGMGTLGDIAAFVAPIAAAIATGGMSLPAQIAAAAAAGGVGGVLSGKDPLKAALISGGTAGIMGGTGANAAIGRAVGSIGGPLAAKATEEVAKTAAEKAAEQIIVTGLSKAAQGAGSAIGNTLLSQGIKGGLSEITGFKTPAERFAEQPLPEAFQPPADMYAGLDPMVVTALSKSAQGAGNAIGNTIGSTALSEVAKGPLSEVASAEKTAEDIEAERNPMIVTGAELETLTPDELLAALGGLGGLAAATAGGGAGASSTAATQAEDDIIKVTGRLPTKTPPVIAGVETALPAITAGALTAAQTGGAPNDGLTAKEIADYLRLAGLAIGVVGGGGGGGGGGGTPGSQAINPIFSAKLPTPGAGGAFKVGGLDYTTPPARSAADMYRYAMGPAMDIPAGMNLSGATSPYAGYGPGTLGEETFKRITGMAHGGSMGYARGSSRDSFAVEGPGTGRSDDIPAVLSDGEYVIDAETVALLGDGSSKAGAKKLDELRVKVRKHKGRNLAKGKFSVNAKRPEKYLSGGRT